MRIDPYDDSLQTLMWVFLAVVLIVGFLFVLPAYVPGISRAGFSISRQFDIHALTQNRRSACCSDIYWRVTKGWGVG